MCASNQSTGLIVGSGKKAALCAVLVSSSLVVGLVLYFSPTGVPPQPDPVEDIYNLWVATYSHDVLDSWVSVVECQQGGFVLACSSGDLRVRIIRVDDGGNATWERYLTEGGHTEVRDLYECQNGDLVMTGFRVVSESQTRDNPRLWLLRMGQNGTVLWEKLHPGFDTGACVVECRNGDLVVAASFSHLVRLDSEGNVLWNRTYSGGEASWASCVVECEDGGLAFAGSADVNPNQGTIEYGAWLVRTDADGVKLWDMTWGYHGWYCWSVTNCSDGGFALAGESGNPREFRIARTSADGSVLWDRTYCRGYARTVVETRDGGLAVTGTLANDSTYAHHEAFFVRTDALGNPLWSSIASGPDEERVCSLSVCMSGDFVVAGITRHDNMCFPFLWRLADSDVPASDSVTTEIPAPPNTKPALTYAAPAPSKASATSLRCDWEALWAALNPMTRVRFLASVL